MSGWELLCCPDCGHEHTRVSERRFAMRCQCGGRFDVYALNRGIKLITVQVGYGCGVSRPLVITSEAGVSSNNAAHPLRSHAEVSA